MIIFIDEILVYSKILKEEEQHLRIVLQTLKEDQLYAKFCKCEFLLNQVDPTKIEAMQKWHEPVQ